MAPQALELVDAMRNNELRRVLCVGSGISQEPRALAWAGFDVTAMDLSPFAMHVARDAEPPDEFLAKLVGGRGAGNGGRVDFVVGNLRDARIFPGPFDVVIDRKTLQLYPDAERPLAMQAVADRLAPRGIFFCHCHDGAWRPPDPRKHAAEPWFAAQGWRRFHGDGALAGRVAWLLTTTG